MTETSVRTSIDNRGIATITLDRQDKHNAFDDGVICELREAFQGLRENDRVRVVVLRGAGKHFSAGGDLAWMRRMAEYDYGHNMEDAEQLAGMLQDLYRLPMPTVAVVQGAAFGGAVGLVSCCDMALAGERARFALSEVRIGLIPASIGPYVVRAIGERAASRYMLTGEAFDAATALRLGLVSEACADDELEARTAALVDELLAGGPAAQRAAKDLVRSVAGAALTPALIEDTCARIAHIRVSEEGQEGLSAFLEKRAPAWRGPAGNREES
ncbi:MAG TPA: gamma-carboxygeranoyl-CoA hydratase [Halieaceae bacterium]|nr:gamma-carboxygeranoyl-CoA hydratase [Halieaceae bacterium]